MTTRSLPSNQDMAADHFGIAVKQYPPDFVPQHRAILAALRITVAKGSAQSGLQTEHFEEGGSDTGRQTGTVRRGPVSLAGPQE